MVDNTQTHCWCFGIDVDLAKVRTERFLLKDFAMLLKKVLQLKFFFINIFVFVLEPGICDL